MLDPSNIHISTISTNPTDNFQSTQDTIAEMRQLVIESLPSPEVQAASVEILTKINKATPTEQDIIRGVYWWVKNHIQFTQDENILMQELGYRNLGTGKDLLISPILMLQYIKQGNAYGECDDFSTLLATLLIYMGVQNVYFCTIAADRVEPDFFSHVYVKAVLMDGSIIPLDASHGQYPGWQTGNIFKSMEWSIVATPSATPEMPSSQPSVEQALLNDPSAPDNPYQNTLNAYFGASTAQSIAGWFSTLF